jgi:hypothetical protein
VALLKKLARMVTGDESFKSIIEGVVKDWENWQLKEKNKRENEQFKENVENTKEIKNEKERSNRLGDLAKQAQIDEKFKCIIEAVKELKGHEYRYNVLNQLAREVKSDEQFEWILQAAKELKETPYAKYRSKVLKALVQVAITDKRKQLIEEAKKNNLN